MFCSLSYFELMWLDSPYCLFSSIFFVCLFVFHRYDAIIISGTEMAKQIQKEIQHGVDSWVSLGNRRPHLSIILVGDNPASHTYVRKKIKAAAAVGGEHFSCTCY